MTRAGAKGEAGREAYRAAGVDVVAGETAVEHRLATILRRLAGVLRAEPFQPSAARELGAALVESGL